MEDRSKKRRCGKTKRKESGVGTLGEEKVKWEWLGRGWHRPEAFGSLHSPLRDAEVWD